MNVEVDAMKKIKSLAKRGLWPFTPDPASAGLYIFGTPSADAPLLITTNSAHTINHLQRILSPFGARVLAIDVAGVDVRSALAEGNFNQESIDNALCDFEAAATQAGDLQDMGSRQALLPYPVWEALRDEKLDTPNGWQLLPGPASAHCLPAYLAGGSDLTEHMKAIRLSFTERLKLAFAHSGLFFMLAALPLALFGLLELAAGAGLIILGAFLAAVLSDSSIVLESRNRLIVLTAGLVLVALSLAWAIYSGNFARLAFMICAIGIFSWELILVL